MGSLDRAVAKGKLDADRRDLALGRLTVTDDRDDRAPVTSYLECLGEPIGIRQRGGRVRVLDPIVRTLGAARVSGQAGVATSRVSESIRIESTPSGLSKSFTLL